MSRRQGLMENKKRGVREGGWMRAEEGWMFGGERQEKNQDRQRVFDNERSTTS